MHNYENLIQPLIKLIQVLIQTIIMDSKDHITSYDHDLHPKNHHSSLNWLNVIPSWINSYDQTENPNSKIQMSSKKIKIT